MSNKCYLRVIQPDGITRKCRLVYNNERKSLILNNNLPLDYQEVEYIESTGVQYIDTGIKGNQDTCVEIKINTSSAASAQFFFGARKNNATEGFCALLWTNNNIFSEYRNSGNIASSFVYTRGEDCKVVLDKNQLYVNDVVYTTHSYNTFQTPGNIALFGVLTMSTFDTAQSLRGRIYYCKIYDNGNLVRDFVPCYRKDNNTIGMYDKVSKQLFINCGTGTFTKGNDVN